MSIRGHKPQVHCASECFVREVISVCEVSVSDRLMDAAALSKIGKKKSDSNANIDYSAGSLIFYHGDIHIRTYRLYGTLDLVSNN